MLYDSMPASTRLLNSTGLLRCIPTGHPSRWPITKSRSTSDSIRKCFFQPVLSGFMSSNLSFTRALSSRLSFPLDRSRRLTGHVIDHAIDALDLVDDPGRDVAQELHVVRIEVRRHAVGRRHCAQADDKIV